VTHIGDGRETFPFLISLGLFLKFLLSPSAKIWLSENIKKFDLTDNTSGSKPLDGHTSLKFLLETRLKSKAFDTLDDLLGCRVQKLWSKINKLII